MENSGGALYWINVSTLSGSEARVGDISEEQLTLLGPILNELGAALEFGQMGSSEILGGCLATVMTDEGSDKAFVIREDDLSTRH